LDIDSVPTACPYLRQIVASGIKLRSKWIGRLLALMA
jgi:hypothetical protein